MKNFRQSVRDVIAERIVPRIELDGISKLLLPEQITPDDCIKSKKCNKPYNPPHREHDIIIGLTGRAPYCIDKKPFVFTPGRIMLLPGGTPCATLQRGWWRVMDLDPNQTPSILWLMVFPFGVRVQVFRIDIDADGVEASQPYVLLGRHFHRLTSGLLEEVRSASPHSSDIGRCFLMEFMYRCLQADTAAYTTDIANISPRCLSRAASRSLPRGKLRSSDRPGARHRSTSLTTGKSPKAGPKKPSSQIQTARDFIHSHYHTPINLDDIAEAVDTSIYNLCRQFKADVGMPPIAYLLEVRMSAARELLLTDLKVFEVGRLVGIEDHCYFSRLFRRINGVGPLAYRRKMAKSAKTKPPPQKPAR